MASSERAQLTAEELATTDGSCISVLIEEALVGSGQQEMLGEQSVAADEWETAGGEMGLDPSLGVDVGQVSAEREPGRVQAGAAVQAAEVVANH